MSIHASQEIEILRRTLARFVREEVRPLEEEHRLPGDVAPPAELRRRVRMRSHELGLYAADMPREVGGAGLPLAERVVLDTEAFSHETVFFDDLLGGPGGPSSILLACNAEQRSRYLLPLVRGETSTCFALSEPEAGSDASGLRLRAEKRGDRYVLNGSKNIITNAVQCDFAMVFAVTDPARGAMGGITCFLVDAGTPGFSVGRSHTCMGFSGFQGELVFENCELPAGAILGQEGFGLALALDWINANRIKIGAMAAGILVLGLNAGSYGAEIVRGSILAVPRGQIEAAIALNLTPFQRMWRIVLPQAAAAMIPPATNTLIELLKNTSLVSLITIADLTFQGQIIRASTLKSAEVFLLLLALYLALSMVIRTFMRRIEKRYSLSWRPVGGLT
ncbi:MAG: acyl-CoA dehydrogenase family protein [Candidatus Omnitrophica bacterium]|nr:acyl-CoA dehydrogenase family protein [Candidatus Omnitrophota bacterium]